MRAGRYLSLKMDGRFLLFILWQPKVLNRIVPEILNYNMRQMTPLININITRYAFIFRYFLCNPYLFKSGYRHPLKDILIIAMHSYT